MKRDFLDLADFTGPELRGMLDLARAIKGRRRTPDDAGDRALAGRKIAMVFELLRAHTPLFRMSACASLAASRCSSRGRRSIWASARASAIPPPSFRE